MEQVALLALGALIAGAVGWFREWEGEKRAAAAAARVVLAELRDNESRILAAARMEPTDSAWSSHASTISKQVSATTVGDVQAAHHCFRLIHARALRRDTADAQANPFEAMHAGDLDENIEESLATNLADARTVLLPLSDWSMWRAFRARTAGVKKAVWSWTPSRSP